MIGYGSDARPYRESPLERIVEVGWGGGPVAILYADAASSLDIRWQSPTVPNAFGGYSEDNEFGDFNVGDEIPRTDTDTTNWDVWKRTAFDDITLTDDSSIGQVYGPGTHRNYAPASGCILQPGPTPGTTGATHGVHLVGDPTFPPPDYATFYEVFVEGSRMVEHYDHVDDHYQGHTYLDYTDGRSEGNNFGYYSTIPSPNPCYNALIADIPNYADGYVTAFDMEDFVHPPSEGSFSYNVIDDYRTQNIIRTGSYLAKLAYQRWNACEDPVASLWVIPYNDVPYPALEYGRRIYLMNFGFVPVPGMTYPPVGTSGATGLVFQTGRFDPQSDHTGDSFSNTYRLMIYPPSVHLYAGAGQTIVAKDDAGHPVAPIYDQSRTVDWNAQSVVYPVSDPPQLRFNKSGWL
jgi:hypothetical protein